MKLVVIPVGSLTVIFLLLFTRNLSFIELAQDFVVELKVTKMIRINLNGT
jgi:hypothetical protein